MASTSNTARGEWRSNRWVFESLFVVFPAPFVALVVLLAVFSVLVPWPWVLVLGLGAVVAFFSVLVLASLRKPSDSP